MNSSILINVISLISFTVYAKIIFISGPIDYQPTATEIRLKINEDTEHQSTYIFSNNLKANRRKQLEESLRGLLFSSWSAKQNKEAKAVWFTKEGDRTEYIYQVEQLDDKKCWGIKIQIKAWVYNRAKQDGTFRQEEQVITSCKLKMIKASKNSRGTLYFLDENGKIVQEL